MDQTQEKKKKLKVVMLPWLAHGHVSPFIELAKELSKRNFHIYFCSTPIILNSIKEKISSTDHSNIELVELHLPPNPDLPPHLHTTRGLPPHLKPTLMKSFLSCGPTFSLILHDRGPDLVLYDMCGQWVPPLAATLNIPAVYLILTGATSASFFLHQAKRHGEKFPFPDIFLRDVYGGKLSPGQNSTQHENVLSFKNFLSWFELSSSIILIKASKVVEEKYIAYLSELTGKKIIPLGPLLHPNPSFNEDDIEQVNILKWLDKKQPSSTVFVSFGSEFYLGKEELEELAYGLEHSNANFIWVIRFPTGEKLSVEEAIPNGFLERVGERGFVVDGWAPQAKILSHKNVGGYVSHCGWGSTLEGVYFGVPIIAMPMQFEHPITARFVEEVGVGVEVLRDGDGKFRRGEVARVIKEVVVEENGKVLRRKARQIGENMRKEGEEAANCVAEEVTKLCEIY